MCRCKALLGAFMLILATNLFATDEVLDEQKNDINFNILRALGIEEQKPEEAIEIYLDAYKKTNSPIYLKEAIIVAFVNKSKRLVELLNQGSSVLVGDPDYIRVKVAYLVSIQAYNNARYLMQSLVKQEESARNYAILGTTEIFMNLNVDALKNFEKSYSLEQSEDNLLRVVDVLVNKFGNSAQAIRYLEAHRRIYGCGVYACSTLVDIYKGENKYLDLINIYEALYASSSDTTYLDQALSVYLYLGNNSKSIEFLNKYKINQKLLAELYAQEGEYDKAFEILDDEFKKTNDYEYLAMRGVYEYEINSANLNDAVLKEIIDKFDKSVDVVDKAVYFNYYGYLLIDHGIDIKKGMYLVEKALAKDPASPYYIDSLAWGYYKLGDCTMARDIMNTIKETSEFKDSDESKEHMRIIKKCAIKQDKIAKQTTKDNNDTR